MENDIRPDLRCQLLFPNDPDKRAQMKDIDAEWEDLDAWWMEYLNEVRMTQPGSEVPKERRKFYWGLMKEVFIDRGALQTERYAFLEHATPLGRFRYKHLDQDGGMIGLEERMQKGLVYPKESDSEVQGEYREPFTKYQLEWRFRTRHEIVEMGDVIYIPPDGWFTHSRWLSTLDGYGKEVRQNYEKYADQYPDVPDPIYQPSNRPTPWSADEGYVTTDSES